MIRYVALAAAAASAALIGWHWRRYCAWWGSHDRAGTALLLATLSVAAVAAGLTRLAWTGGFDPHPYEASLPTRILARWWATKADGHRLDVRLDTTRAAIAAGLVVLLGAVAHVLRPTGSAAPASRKESWHAPERITDALLAAKILTSGKDGLNPRVTHRGKVQRTDHGEQLTLTLPAGKTLDDVTRGRVALASALAVPAELLDISQPVDAPANAVTLWVGKPRPAGQIGSGKLSTVATAARTTWIDGAAIGPTPRGHTVTVRTTGVHTLVVGAPESGKSRTVRIILAHALLDVTVTVRIVNGKADAADWEAAAPACADYVGQIDDDMPAAVERILNTVLAESRAVAAASRKTGRAVVGNVLVIEEWAAIRTHCLTVLGPQGLERIDKAMATVLATTRSAGTHVILITQRPTADSFPTAQRANVVQRVVHRTTSAGDTSVALGQQPENPRPQRRGQALILDAEHGERIAFIDDLPDDAWEAVCARAARLRGVRDLEISEPDLKVEPETYESEPVVDPLLAAAAAALAEPGQLTPTELFEALPEDLRPTSAATLGRRLAARGLASQMVDKRRVYTHDAAVSAVSAAVSVPSP